MANRKDIEENNYNKGRRDFIKIGSAAALAAMAVKSMPLSAKALPPTSLTRHFFSQQELSNYQGVFKQLVGTWSNKTLPGHGFNMIALPYPKGPFAYRLLVNQYNEELTFQHIDENVANRGLPKDQFVTAITYQQSIKQIAAEDNPVSGEAGGKNLDIHHEVGKFLYIKNPQKKGLDIARIAVVPHGDSVLALGNLSQMDGMPDVKDFAGLPISTARDINSPYLAPYKYFHEHPFKGVFDPLKPSDYLKSVNENEEITKTTVFTFDSRNKSGGIKNIPFINQKAKATEMQSTFYLQELADLDENGNPKLRLQYIQLVMLDFFQRGDGEGLIRWPHISVNTLEKVVMG